MRDCKKRVLSLVLAVCLCFSVAVTSVSAASGSMKNFRDVYTYHEGYFTDIEGWYKGSITRCYSLGLIDGKAVGVFDPKGNITIAESIKLAACLHSIYYTGGASFVQGNPWYQVYVDYCLTKGILKDNYSNYNAKATRAQFARIFSMALPEEALPVINTVEDNAIPDVKVTDNYGPDIYKLYRAGIVEGSDNAYRYFPSNNITRGEVAAIMTRLADESLRKYFTLRNEVLNAEQISQKCASAVFYIEIYNASGKATASGSGVFLSSDGLAVTNHHVVDDAYSAKIKTADGKAYNVKGYYDFDSATDLALIQVDGTGFSSLNRGDSRNLTAGTSVFALGSPLGLDNTLSEGIISNPARIVDGLDYIQITAPISNGSSGGALLNNKGELIGITSAGFDDGQNLNLAVPAYHIDELEHSTVSSFPLKGSGSNPYSASLSCASAVSVTVGSTTNFPVTVVCGSYTGYYKVNLNLEDSSLVTASWSSWSGSNVTLYLKGVKSGATKATLTLYNSDNNTVLYQTTITISVTGKSVVCYSGYSPAPDFGAYLGIKAYDTATTSEAAIYWYASSSISDIESALDGYLTLLEKQGFTYAESWVNDDGNTVLAYGYGTTSLYVCLNADGHNGVACLQIMLFYL